MLNIIPGWAKIALVAALIVGILFGWSRLKENYRDEGRAEVRSEWDAEKEATAKKIKELEAKAGRVSTVVETKVIERVKIVTEKGDAITKVVKVFVPTDSGMLDGGFRVFHDAASTNTIPNPAEIPNAAAIAVTDVASTIAANYNRCHVAYAVVEGWQQWATEQCKLNTGGCPDGGQ